MLDSHGHGLLMRYGNSITDKNTMAKILCFILCNPCFIRLSWTHIGQQAQRKLCKPEECGGLDIDKMQRHINGRWNCFAISLGDLKFQASWDMFSPQSM